MDWIKGNPMLAAGIVAVAIAGAVALFGTEQTVEWIESLWGQATSATETPAEGASE